MCLQVKFVGEGAIDLGGPRREFFRLLVSSLKQLFFRGSDTAMSFNNNVSALQVTAFVRGHEHLIFQDVYVIVV